MNGFILFLVMLVPHGISVKEVHAPVERFLDVQECIEVSGRITDAGVLQRGQSLWCVPVVFEDGYAAYHGE